MSVVDLLWPMMGAASLTLGLIHLTIWLRSRGETAHLIFFVAAVSAATIAICELLLMHADTTDQYARILRWAHVPVASLLVALVAFVIVEFKVSARWLGISASVLRVVSLIPNFATGVNLNFDKINALNHVELFGQDGFVTPVGEPNSWMIVAQLSGLLLVLFFIQTVISVRRRNDVVEYRRAVFVCGSMCLFVFLGSLWTALVVLGFVSGPLTLNVGFFGIVMVMSYELGRQVLEAAAIARDLAKRDADLRESELRMTLAAEAAGLGMWTWEFGSGELWLTDQGGGLLDIPAGPLNREQILSRIHPDDISALREAKEDAVKWGLPYINEFRYLSPNLKPKWIRAKGRVEYAPEGEPIRLRGVIYDITEKKQADERFQVVVDSAQTAMIMVDKTGRMVLVNKQAELIFEYDRSEMLGSMVDILFPFSSRKGHVERPEEFFESPRTRSMGSAGQVFGTRKDGSAVPLDIGLTPICISGEDFVLASISDIGERLRSEQEIALQRDEVAHLSRVAMLGEISGSLAHELNQPLTSILSNAQAAIRFLDHSPPNLSEVRASLSQIADSDKRASEVIRRLRGMLRKEKPDYEGLELNSLIQETVRLLHSDLLTRNVSIDLELDPGIPPAMGDRVQIQQVLLNLIINGCDAMERIENGRALRISTRLDDDGSVLVSIADRGHGIPDQDLERIFMPFVTTKDDGIGLGLAICGTILRTHRGKLWAVNNVHGGATISFTLPTTYA